LCHFQLAPGKQFVPVVRQKTVHEGPPWPLADPHFGRAGASRAF
jgi:hypothetical protein